LFALDLNQLSAFQGRIFPYEPPRRADLPGLRLPVRKFKVPAREQKEFVLLLAPMRKEIVER
jgi:hypothetical protein